MPVEAYSTTPISNSASPPNGFPEGMQPADVNNSARQVMADLATLVRQFPWLLLSTGRTVVRNSNLQFQITGADDTSVYTVGRRIRSRGGSTVYGVVTSSSFSAGNTTVNVTNDGAANLPSPLTAVDVADVDANVLKLDSAGLFTNPIANSAVSAGNVTQHRIPLNTSLGTVTSAGSTNAGIFSDLNSLGYDKLEFELELRVSALSSASILTDSNNGASPDTGASDYSSTYWYNSNTTNVSALATGASMTMIPNVASGKIAGRVTIESFGSGSDVPFISWDLFFDLNGVGLSRLHGGGFRNSAAAINWISIGTSNAWTSGSYVAISRGFKR